ncbi:MAG: FtsX-like permease family protein [Coriobacteriia bacterium]|nr:FtsX-like permease family protein [Coriobacteriia bacterium]
MLALGERRIVIVSQIVFEVIVIALIAICASLFIGNFISSGISETMLRNSLVAGQIADTGMTFSTLDFMGFSNNVPIEEVMTSYDTSLNGVTVAIFFAATIGTVMVATIAPMLYILRLNPRKIML